MAEPVRTCPVCQLVAAPDARFCSNCGSSLDGDDGAPGSISYSQPTQRLFGVLAPLPTFVLAAILLFGALIALLSQSWVLGVMLLAFSAALFVLFYGAAERDPSSGVSRAALRRRGPCLRLDAFRQRLGRRMERSRAAAVRHPTGARTAPARAPRGAARARRRGVSAGRGDDRVSARPHRRDRRRDLRARARARGDARQRATPGRGRAPGGARRRRSCRPTSRPTSPRTHRASAAPIRGDASSEVRCRTK